MPQLSEEERAVEAQIERAQRRLSNPDVARPKVAVNKENFDPSADNSSLYVPSTVHSQVTANAAVHASANDEVVKTIDRWQFSNVKKHRVRMESDETERNQKEKADKQFVKDLRARAQANWKRMTTKHREEPIVLNTAVVVRDTTSNAPLQKGVVTAVDADGTFTIRVAKGTLHRAVIRDNIIEAPGENEAIAVGARVGVKFDQKPDLFMGVVTAINKDRSYSITYDGGTNHPSISRSMVTLFQNEENVCRIRKDLTMIPYVGTTKLTPLTWSSFRLLNVQAGVQSPNPSGLIQAPRCTLRLHVRCGIMQVQARWVSEDSRIS